MNNPISKIPLNERGVEDAFRQAVQQQAQDMGGTFRQFSLGGADRDLGDAVITANFRYALVEFKFTQEQLKKEGSKELREVLCVALSHTKRKDIRRLHNACHFASWLDPQTDECLINIYQREICNLGVFHQSKILKSALPDITTRVSAKEFARELFQDETAALTLEEFQSYVDWMRMVQAAEGGQVTGMFTIVAFDPNTGKSILLSGDDFVLLDNFLREVADKLSHQQANTRPTGSVPPSSTPGGSGGP